jgi:hypothetical protein
MSHLPCTLLGKTVLDFSGNSGEIVYCREHNGNVLIGVVYEKTGFCCEQVLTNATLTFKKEKQDDQQPDSAN